MQHARFPCPSTTFRVYWNSCPLSRWCHPAIASSVVPFSRPQSFPASGSSPISPFFASGGQSIGVSNFSISPSNEYSGLISFRIDWILRLRIFNLSTNDILKRTTEDEMDGWHHEVNGHGFGWTPGVGDGQGGLACCGPWGRKESDTTEWLNWAELEVKVITLVSTMVSYFSIKGECAVD